MKASVSPDHSIYSAQSTEYIVTLACLRTTYLVRQHPPLTSPIGRVQQHIPRYQQRLDRDNVTTTPRSEASDRQCGFSRLTAITLYEVQNTKYGVLLRTYIRSYLVLDLRHFYLFNQTYNIMHLNSSSIQSTVYILVCAARCSKYVLCTICISQRCTTPVSLMQYYARRRFGK